MKKRAAISGLIILLIVVVVPASAAFPAPNTWYPTSVGMSIPVDVLSFAFSPNYANDHVVYAGTYTGVYRSTDSGFNWSRIGATGSVVPGAANSLAISPNYAVDRTLYAGTSSGIYFLPGADTALESSNWTDITGDLPTNGVTVIAFSPNFTHDNLFFVGTWGYGLFITNNINGSSTQWFVQGSLLNTTSSRISSIVFTPDYTTSHALFVGVSANSDGGGVYYSNKTGEVWQPLVTGLADGVHKNVTSLALSPNYLNDHTIFAGVSSSQGVYKSTNSGGSWEFCPGTDNWTVLSMAISPDYQKDGVLFAGGEYPGVAVTTDGCGTWTEMNAGFDGAKAPQALVIPPDQSRQPFYLFAGTYSDQVWQMLYQGQSKLFIPLIVR